MTNPQQSYPAPMFPPVQAPPAPVKKPKRWPWILGIIGAFILGIIIGSAGKSSTPTAATTGTQPAVAAPSTSAPAAPAEPAGPKTSFGDGTFKVGEDIAAGTYKSTGPRAGSVIPNCYWGRMKDDSGDLKSIIANDNTSGATRITVKNGEYLKVSGCDFAKA